MPPASRPTPSLPLGPCPACGGPLDPSRVLASEVREVYPAPGVDTEVSFWTFRISCAGCLAAVTVRDGVEGRDISVACSGAVVVRLRDRLAAARAAGRLADELAALSADERILLNTPELLAEIAGHDTKE